MTTPRTGPLATAVTVATLALASTALGSGTLDAAPRTVAGPAARYMAGHGASAAPASRSAYAWPVKPFNRQHPVRGFFGDPRISNHGRNRQFHFGVDISAPNGTPVYATITGSVSIHPLHRTTVMIVGRSGLEFSYWHVVPTVRTGQRAIAYRTVIGRIEAPYGHVHFSERRAGRYLNPLRPGAMGPFVDGTRPRVVSVRAERTDGFALVAEAYDETPLAVARPWHDLPVMPALVRWRLLDAWGHALFGWRTAADFRMTIPPASTFDDVWAPGTTQNHVRSPGSYRIRIAKGSDLPFLRDGMYVVQVLVADTRGNAGRAASRISIDFT